MPGEIFQVGLVEVIGVGDKLAFVRGGKVMRRIRSELVNPGRGVGIPHWGHIRVVG